MISLVIPVYNEKASLEELVRRVVAVDMPKELIVIDDCSTDGSREILARLAERGLPVSPAPDRANENRLEVLFQERNQGKGAALRRGFAAATGDVVIVQDADWSTTRARFPGWSARSWTGTPTWCSAAASSATTRRVLYYWHAVVQLGAHHALQHDHGPEPDGHGDLLQGLPPRGASSRIRSRRTGSASSRRSPPRWPAPGLRASTRCRSATTAAPTRKGRRSAGRTGSARSYAIAKYSVKR